MTLYRRFNEVPLSSITPEGWLRCFLEKQKKGLTGFMENAGYPFNTDGWADPDIPARSGMAWWPYEQTAYWVDGALRCGHLLRDDFLINKAVKQVDTVVSNPDKTGYLGPDFLKNGQGWSRWPHAVFFRAFMAHHSASGDERIPNALGNHYLADDWPYDNGRDLCNVEHMLWAYEHLGDKRLLERAEEAYRAFNKNSPDHDNAENNVLSDKPADIHGVTYNEIGKLGAILYTYTGKKQYLQATINAYEKMRRDQELADGVPSSSERLRGKDPLDSHETCDIADYTWGLGYLLKATGKAVYADRIEKACFNAGPGAVRKDFKALQYFSCPNQVIADGSSNHNIFVRGDNRMSYRPNPGTECCPGEVNRIMPNYAARMWMRADDGGVAACLYGPSSVTLPVGRENRQVTIVEDTDYPFDETVSFYLQIPEGEAEFPFSLRIPSWCNAAALYHNEDRVSQPLKPQSFVTLSRTFKDGDYLTLQLPMETTVAKWPRNGISVERGPLVYALRIEEDWQRDTTEECSTDTFPAWDLYPATDWNYALDIDEDNPANEVEVCTKEPTPDPWSIETAPIYLRVPARKVRDWRIRRYSVVTRETFEPKIGDVRHKHKGDFRLTPQLPDPASLKKHLGNTQHKVTLVPYGCTHLRITVFPHVINPGDDSL